MKRHICGRVTLGLLIIGGLLLGGGVSSYAGSRVFAAHRAFAHHRFFFRPCCFGPRIVLGVGVAPFWYPYPVYDPPVVADSSPPAYLEQDLQPQQQYWYYCEGARAYYPYVKECPGGWLQVAPQPSSPSS